MKLKSVLCMILLGIGSMVSAAAKQGDADSAKQRMEKLEQKLKCC